MNAKSNKPNPATMENPGNYGDFVNLEMHFFPTNKELGEIFASECSVNKTVSNSEVVIVAIKFNI